MPEPVHVTHLAGDQFQITIRGHQLRVDQPLDAGGHDAAPTPTELFVASLASCVAHYARRYCARHDINTDGLDVRATYQIGEHPTRVSQITVTLTPPHALPAERYEAFLAVASHCTVHNSLEQPPDTRIELASGHRP